METKNKVKQIRLVNKDDLVKRLNKNFSLEDLNTFYKIFDEQLKNKWIEIPNKNLYFNKEIMACYPNFKVNFQNITANTSESYFSVLKNIKDNSEYKKYGIDWDIQTWREFENSFYNTNHPMEENSYYHYINGRDYLIYRLGEDIKSHSTYYENSGIRGLVVPVFRLGDEEDYELFEAGEVDRIDYSEEYILDLFLVNKLIPRQIYNNEELREKYSALSIVIQFYNDFIEDYVIDEKNKTLKIEWDTKKIVEEIIKNHDRNKRFGTNIIEFLYENGDREERTYTDGILSGKTVYYFKNREMEEAFYENGVLSGDSTYFIKNNSREKRTYVNGVLQGKSTCYYSNGDIEERSYVNGVLEGEAIVYNNRKEIIRKYEFQNGVKKDITELYNYLNIDKTRVNLDKYDENILFDPNRGHWDLVKNEKDKSRISASLGKKVYSRDPKFDIKEGGIVGIDFGTKSTVVVFQDDNKILPMRISGDVLSKEIEKSDYENPTVIEFINIEKFMRDYNSKKGRPLTKWEDVTVSHTAFSNLINGTNEQFYSTISDLKQWSASKNEKLIIRDKNRVEKLFNPYLELKEDDIDPIEIYAYYIGSYINNMRNGIYLEYFLSFPVTYENEIRNKILKSFEKGIKKSLPISILEDNETMKKFSVSHGANEPAAYSICALQEYGFEPEDEEKVYYGVFDFGGGTADFDFGIWRASKDERSYDFELEHFGAGGDRYLGGENILKELAFEVFKENKESLRKAKISFYKPEWCERFMGDEVLVDSSQEAKLNIKKLMEKLRCVWEKTEKLEEIIKIPLYNKRGEKVQGLELSVDEKKLNKIIEDKINGGINNFFIAMEKAFKDENCDKIIVLLAGNSCKHPLVKETFEKYIKDKEKNIEIYPALGTEEAYKKMEENGITPDREDKTRPTGKTGVAYGLLNSRAGGRIKIINRDENKNENNEINFKYYVGYERRKKLKVILNPQTEYNSPIYLLNVTAKVFDLYYTSLPEAIDGKLLVEKVKRKRIVLNENYGENAKIFIKAVGVDTLNYIITKNEISEKNYLEEGNITLD